MKVLIIGGTGVLSTAVTKEIISEGNDVTMINRGHHTIPEGVRFIKADCNDDELIKQSLAGQSFDAVLDFICYDKSQLEHSLRLFSPVAEQYFFISSTAVIDSREGGILNEDSAKVLPFWGYSVCKWEAEQFLTSFCKEHGVNYTIIRPCVTYDDTRIPYGIAPRYGFHWTLIERAKAGKPIITWNGGKNRCNMMRVEDFAVGVAGLIGNTEAYGKAFNVCGDEVPSFGEVLNALSKASGQEISTIDIPIDFYSSQCSGREGEILARGLDSVHSNALIKSLVPLFKQQTDIVDGVSKTVQAYISSGYGKGIDWRFDAETDYVIKKWCHKNHLSCRHYHLGFVNYHNKATLKDRVYYWFIMYQDSLPVRLYRHFRSS